MELEACVSFYYLVLLLGYFLIWSLSWEFIFEVKTQLWADNFSLQ